MFVPEVTPVKVAPSRVTVGAARSTKGTANAHSALRVRPRNKEEIIEGEVFNEQLGVSTRRSSSFYVDT